MRKIIAMLAVVILLVSCSVQDKISSDYDTPETWAELFEIFWSKMSGNYVFWSLDYDKGRGWDDVYDDYLPLFEELGGIEASGDETKTAFQYFYEITSPLSDGHYYLDITDGEDLFTSYPSMRRKMLERGYTDEEIFELFDSWDGNYFSLFYTTDDDGGLTADEDSVYFDYFKLYYENIYNILMLDFDWDLGGSQESSQSSNPGDFPPSPFSASMFINDSSSSSSDVAALVQTDDGIAYFGLGSFFFTKEGDNAESFLTTYRQAMLDATGIIIDLRGNSGGYIDDLQILWSVFTGGNDVTFAESRRKDGDNRTDYGVWMDMTIEDEGYDFDSSVPIAVLMNGNSASAAEGSMLFFKALRDYYGYNVRFFGETTAGAFGAILQSDTDDNTSSGSSASENYYNSGLTWIAPYITTIYTPFTQVRYRSGKNYEGKGLEPDETYDFSYEDFLEGTDAKLDAAYSWLYGGA